MKLDHIENLYRPESQVILLFKEVYALEKIHGTATSLEFNPQTNIITYASGGETHNKFISLFNNDELILKFKELGIPLDRTVKIFGECYGASQQGMSHTYGKTLKFIAFDVQIGDKWLNVPDAEIAVKSLGLEFVHYNKVSTDLVSLDVERDAPSVQAKRNGIIEDKLREGVILRPLVEMTLNNGKRVICKHKGSAFQETSTPRPVVDPSKLKVLHDAESISLEWVNMNRLNSITSKIPNLTAKDTLQVILAMVEDVKREGEGEIVWSDEVAMAIKKLTAKMFKDFLNKA